MMKYGLAIAAFGAVSMAAGWQAAPPAEALMPSCKVGQRVKSPAGKPAIVTKVTGSSCTIRVDGNSYDDVYAAFMLEPLATVPDSTPPAKTPAPKPQGNAAASTALALGTYQCTGGPAGNLTLRLLSATRYGDGYGNTGSYSAAPGGYMQFSNGPLEGNFAKGLAGGRIGLTSDPKRNFFYMTCDRR